MTLPPAARKAALAVHLTASIGWIGAALAYLALGLTARVSPDASVIRSAWTAMEVVGWLVLVPLAVGSLLTGIVMSVGTHWGLLQHYWVVVSLSLTTIATVVLVLHMPDVSEIADQARRSDDATVRALDGDLLHAGAGIAVLLVVLVLNLYKPRGLTRRGWRRRHGRAEPARALQPVQPELRGRTSRDEDDHP